MDHLRAEYTESSSDGAVPAVWAASVKEKARAAGLSGRFGPGSEGAGTGACFGDRTAFGSRSPHYPFRRSQDRGFRTGKPKPLAFRVSGAVYAGGPGGGNCLSGLRHSFHGPDGESDFNLLLYRPDFWSGPQR